MATITYKPLSSLSPIELRYEYYKKEPLQQTLKKFSNGLSIQETAGFINYRDIAINRESCLVLTSAVSLSAVFTTPETLSIGEIPTSIIIQPRNFSLPSANFAQYNPIKNIFQLTSFTSSILYLQPTENKNEVEILVDNKYAQVDSDYPYVVRTNDRGLDPEEIHRQRFEIVYQNDFITFKTRTGSGDRYLAFNNDNILRAVGLVLNDSIVNDYVFYCIPVTNFSLTQGFIPTNNWVTYYFDVESGVNNKTLVVNKNLQDSKTNLLVDFPLEEAARTGKVNINIANLKTSITPGGGPAPVNNAYTKEIITTN